MREVERLRAEGYGVMVASASDPEGVSMDVELHSDATCRNVLLPGRRRPSGDLEFLCLPQYGRGPSVFVPMSIVETFLRAIREELELR